jgi:hypothetical protein
MIQPDDNYPPQVQKARRQIENGLGSLLDTSDSAWRPSAPRGVPAKRWPCPGRSRLN